MHYLRIIPPLLFAVFLLSWPFRNLNGLVGILCAPFKDIARRLGVDHTPWTMFAGGPHTNHFITLKLELEDGTRIELRDPWMERSLFWQDFQQERWRRMLLNIIRSDTPAARRAWHIERFCSYLVRKAEEAHGKRAQRAEIIFGQEVFTSRRDGIWLAERMTARTRSSKVWKRKAAA